MQQHEKRRSRGDVKLGRDPNGRPVYREGYRREDGVWVCPPAPRPFVADGAARSAFSDAVSDGGLRRGRKRVSE